MISSLQSYIKKKSLEAYRREAKSVDSLSDSMKKLTNGTLEQKFQLLRGRKDRGSYLSAYAIVTEMAHRTLGMRPFLVQIMGALAMGDGKIAEMGTGEGKTLTAGLALAWHGLNGRSHAMTVNDYLAKRDAELLTPLYESLGLTCSFLQEKDTLSARQLAYQASIVYSTASNFVFDFLRDNLITSENDRRQQSLDFLLIDEADSILIDEARTPFILSGAGSLIAEDFNDIKDFVSSLSSCEIKEETRTQLERALYNHQDSQHNSDILIDYKNRTALLTERGHESAEQFIIRNFKLDSHLDVWSPANSSYIKMINSAIRALHLFNKDTDYIVKNNKVIIIDQETGRLAYGKRWNGGLHQAIECKEGVEINPESCELGKIALANYNSLYNRVSGMTGTATSVSEEIYSLYGLDVITIPPHKKCIRIDHADQLYLTESAKLNALVKDVVTIHSRKQPVLIGTSSVQESEKISALLDSFGLPHQLLNAKQDEAEAFIISEAGKPSTITIATSMAGRGTDIILGGKPPHDIDQSNYNKQRELAIKAGGLFVIGSSRLDCRRLDLQLIGRSGRQGDPGESCFYISLEDPLMKHFGNEVIRSFYNKLGFNPDESIQHDFVDQAIAKAQSAKQSIYMESRRIGIQQDCVIDSPRKVIMKFRKEVLGCSDKECINLLLEIIPPAMTYMNDQLVSHSNENISIENLGEKIKQWGLSTTWLNKIFSESINCNDFRASFDKELSNWLLFDLRNRVSNLHKLNNDSVKLAMLHAIDQLWQLFLDQSENIRKGIHLRAYANEKPHMIYKKEIFELFKRIYFEIPIVFLDYVYAEILCAEQQLITEE